MADENKEKTVEELDENEAKTGGENEKTYTQAELDEIVKKRLARERSRGESELEKKLKEAQDELAKRSEAEKLAKMNEDQKTAYRLEQLEKENAALKKAAENAALRKQAAGMLRELNMEATEEALDLVTGHNAEATKTNIERYVALVQSAIKAEEVKRATGSTPKDYPTGEPEEKDPFKEKLKKYK